MFKSLSNIITTSIAKALSLSKHPSQVLSPSPATTTMKTTPNSSSSYTSPTTPAQTEANPQLDTYTATDAANFSVLGASITALPPEEVLVHAGITSPGPMLRCERSGGAVRNSGVGEWREGRRDETEVYTVEQAAEFVRRGACMVVWPGME